MKYKIGQNVKIKKTITEEMKKRGNYYFAPEMEKFQGKIGKIENINGNYYHIFGWSWLEDMLELPTNNKRLQKLKEEIQK